ncbi:MAG: OB-fold nucleic acid binding domain-containing protein, partial [Saprospiraceae bacterium]|nr:OB-fold nucleic acid binding domain-containing protein [Saprospiraceae bacterium]
RAHSLFGESDDVLIPEPSVPDVAAWPMMHRLNQEKEVIGIYASGHPLDSYKLELENFVNCELVHFDRVKALDRRLKVAGIITKALHGINKRGNGYCRFTLQDYNGSIELYLGNDEYQKFKGFIEEGQVVYVDGVFKSRYNSDELFFSPLLVKLLTSVSDELTKSITLKVPVSMINPEFVSSLDHACTDHMGQHHLRMVVFDMDHEVKVRFMSGDRSVKIDSQFVKELDKLGVTYKLN